MYIALGMMILGMILGRALRQFLGKMPISHVMFAAVLAMLFLLGMQIGANESLFAQLHNLGWKSFCLTLFAMGGTIAACWILQRLAGRIKARSHAR